ncbi:MAG: lysophospholipid transporter LplT [Rhodoferax sp.]|uniref:lysophospholipid transporter LplT n=1 Tax=Rhodoferax sp. TaxID=50421 RepID=UPI00301AC1B4
MPRTFFIVLAVQFLSTIADNAFLIVAIARVIEQSAAAWVIPVLKVSFTLFYVLLAPLVGPLADSFPKGRVMLWANFLKVCAVLLLLGGIDPVLALACGGLGAAIYAPAKYGLITELLPADELVRANGFFEGTTVCAVIFGTALGGLLISAVMPHVNLSSSISYLGGTSTALIAGMLCLLALYSSATLLSLGVRDNGVRYPGHSIHPVALIQRFFKENKMLWRDPLGGLSMAVTTLLWGVGATLQLIVLRWASESLGLSLTQAAYLQGVTAVGVIVGAILASRYVRLARATHLLPLGVVLGLLVPVMLLVHSVLMAALLLMVVGALAGYFVVPMNALLQHRGCTLLTAGRSIAVQGFNENAGMLLMLALYALATATQADLRILITSFGVLVSVTMLLILVLQRQQGVLQTTTGQTCS